MAAWSSPVAMTTVRSDAGGLAEMLLGPRCLDPNRGHMSQGAPCRTGCVLTPLPREYANSRSGRGPDDPLLGHGEASLEAKKKKRTRGSL